MYIRNTQRTYGIVSKFLHWILVVLIFLQFYSIFWVRYILPEKSPLIGFYIGKMHKPLGMLTLILAILFLLWKLINIHPSFPSAMAKWEIGAARLTHSLLYLCLIIMPVSGLVMSVAGGRPPNFFGYYQVPMFIEKNDVISNLFFSIHQFTGTLLMGLIALHVLAALKHRFINRDQVLQRMWF